MKKNHFCVVIVAIFAAIFFMTGCKKDLSPATTSQLVKKNAQLTTDPMVATPAGLMPKSHVHVIEQAYQLKIQDGHVFKILASNGKIMADFGEIKAPAAYLSDSFSRSIVKGLTRTGVVPPTGSQPWQTWSEFQNTNQNMINYFSTNWVVPSSPTTNHAQLIYIFNGISKSDKSDLIQPVLQWGNNGVGGGNNWSISNWYVWWAADPNNNNQVTLYSAYSPNIQVNVGTNLKGIINFSGNQPDLSYNYTCAFDGYNNVLTINEGSQTAGVKGQTLQQVTIPYVPQKVWAFEALESYNFQAGNVVNDVFTSTDYPAELDVRMTNIDLEIAHQPATVNWVAQIGQNAFFGEHTKLINYNSPYGEVDLYFHPEPPPPVTINGQGSVDWFNGNGSGSGTINAAPGTIVHVTVSAYGPGTLTNFTMWGAQLSGPMGNSIYIANNSTTQTFTMPSSGSVSWSGYFQRSGSSGTGDIAVN